MPWIVPPCGPNPANNGWPNGFNAVEMAKALASDMIMIAFFNDRFAVTNDLINAIMSVRALVPDVPLEAIGVTPFVIDAGLTVATAATAGSMNWVSMN